MTEIKMRLNRVLFPKNGNITQGEFSIIAADIVAVVDGQPLNLNKYGNIVITSNTSPIQYNKYDTYHVKVEYAETKYGPSYKLLQVCDNADVEYSSGDKRTFLESVLTKRQVDNLYATYDEPYDLLMEKNTSALLKVSGVGKSSINKLYKKYDEALPYQRLMVGLKEFEPSMALMKALLEAYGTSDLAISKVKENVYILADDVKGIGFKKADEKAMKAGMPKDSPFRMKAYIQYFLKTRAEEGNTWVPAYELKDAMENELHIEFDQQLISNCICELNESGILGMNEEGTRYYLQTIRNIEENIYEEILRVMYAPDFYNLMPEIESSIIKETEQSFGYSFTDEQLSAIQVLTKNNFSVLTAAAGTGKTTLIKVITALFEAGGHSCQLCTLSGKASARIFESTGYEGATIHRTLQYDPRIGGFTYDSENKLPYDVIIVDESSFIGGELFLSLISAIHTGSKLILIGDDKQLPAIGMCNVFYDVIQSGVVPTARLSKIHRQAQKSGIMVSSMQIRNGNLLFPYEWEGIEVRGELQDLVIDIYNDRAIGEDKMMYYYFHFVKSLKDARDTQIIVPQKTRGTFSTYKLNNRIQEIINPSDANKKEASLMKEGNQVIIREGDRVINRKNNYRAKAYGEEDKTVEIFNGFCGDVIRIYDGNVVVKFDLCPTPVLFTFESRNNLELAYALTTHLFQGSQIENVIIGIDNGSYKMNSRELLYTAITRATTQCVLVGESAAIYHCIKNEQVSNKNTFLRGFLKKEKF